MADRGRDLEISVLSNAEKFDLDGPARELDDVADKAKDLGRALLDMGKDAVRPLDKFADGARDTARKVDKAFDTIKKSSRDNLREAVTEDLDEAGKGLDEFKDEAAGSGREAAASFGGGFDDITGFIQETAANAFAGFGPLGAAAGIAAAAGIGIITKVFGDNKEKAEEAKAAVQDWVDAFVEGQGKIQESTITGKLNELLGDPEKYREVIDLTDKAGVSAVLYARALSGDAEAAAKLKDQIIEQQKALARSTDTTAGANARIADQAVGLQKLAGKLGIATGQIDKGRDAWSLLDEATRAGIVADVEVNTPTKRELANEAAQMKGIVGRGIDVPVKVDAKRAAQIALLDAQRYADKHPITIRTKPGARPVRDVP
jgi:hypothetical protein